MVVWINDKFVISPGVYSLWYCFLPILTAFVIYLSAFWYLTFLAVIPCIFGYFVIKSMK